VEDAVQARGPAGDRRHEDRAPGPDDAAGLAEGEQPVRSLREVVHRAEQQHGVDRAIGEVEHARIGYRGVDVQSGGGRLRRRLLDVQRHEIAVAHRVAEAGQPHGVAPWTAADIGDDARRSRQVTPDDLLGAGELDRADAPGEPLALGAERVVLVQGAQLV
jgi:hypothetical protein